MNKGIYIRLVIWLVMTLALSAPVFAQLDVRSAVPSDGLEIYKEVSSRLVHAGDSFNYTLYIVNHTENVVNNIRVEDTLTAYAEYVSGSASDGGQFDPATRVLSWEIPHLLGSDTAVLTWTMNTDPNSVDTLVVLNHGFILEPVNLKSNWVITWIKPVYKSILDIDKTPSVSLARPGDTVGYTITVNNSGNFAAQNLDIYDLLPTQAEPITASISGGGRYDPQVHRIDWTLPVLYPNDNIQLDYDAVMSDNIENTVQVFNVASIPIGQDSTIADTAFVTIEPGITNPDLTIDKTADRDSVYHTMDDINYTIRVGNDGNGPAENVTVVDSLPFGVALVPNSTNPHGNYDPDRRTITWVIESIEPGEEIELAIRTMVLVNFLTRTILENRAEYRYDDISDFDTTRTVFVPKDTRMISIEKTANLAFARPGDDLEYKIEVENRQLNSIVNIPVIDTLPGYVSPIVSTINAGGVYNPADHSISWTIDLLHMDEIAELSFSANINGATPLGEVLINTAIIDVPDYHVRDTAATIVVDVLEPDLEIDKSVDKLQAEAGEPVFYTIYVRNTGTAPAAHIEIVDTIPAQVTMTDLYNGGVYDPSARTITWIIDLIHPFERIPLEFGGNIADDAIAGTRIKNIAIIDHPELFDSDSVFTTVTVPEDALLEIDKTVDRPNAEPGDTLLYTITVSNNGEASASSFYLRDELPDMVTAFDYDPSGNAEVDPATGDISWLIGGIDPGAEQEFTIHATINYNAVPGTVLENIAIIDLPDRDIRDTAFTTVDEPTGQPVLSFEKTVNKPQLFGGELPRYTLIARNTGDAPAFDISVVDSLSMSLSTLPNSIYDGGVYNETSNTAEWKIERLEPGETRNMSFEGIYAEDIPGCYPRDLFNHAFMFHGDEVYGDTVYTTIMPPQIDFTIEKSVDKDSANVGDTLSYAILITNTGENSESITVTDYFPDILNVHDISNEGEIVVDYDTFADVILWDLENVSAGETVTLTFKAEIGMFYTGVYKIVNQATLLNGCPNEPYADEAVTIAYNPSEAILSIDKNVDQSIALPGDTLEYTITIDNTGGSGSGNLTVTDRLPSNASVIESSINDNGTYDSNTNEIEWTFGSIASDQQLTLNFNAVIDNTVMNGNIVTNIASLRSGDFEAADTVVTAIEIPEYPVLTIDKQVDKDTTSNGDIVTYSLVVGNRGGVDASSLTISDIIPANGIYVDGSVDNGGVYDQGSNRLDWMIESIPTGGSVTLNFQVQIVHFSHDPGTITNVGSIILGDSTIADTVSSLILGIPKDFELNVEKSVDKSSARAGDRLDYTIAVSNTGEGTAYEVFVADEIPAEIQLIRNSISHDGILNSQLGQLEWTLDSVQAGETINLTFAGIIRNETAAGISVMNVALIELEDGQLADTVYTDILPPIELPFTIVKSVDSVVAQVGSIIRYDISVTNTDTEPLTDILFRDDIPEWTTYVEGSVTGSGRYHEDLDRVVWDWSDGSIAPGHTIDFSFKVKIDDNAPKDYRIPNYAVAEFDAPDVPLKAARPAELVTVNSNTVYTIVNNPTGGEDDPTIVKTVNLTTAAPGNTLTYNIEISNPGPDDFPTVIVTDAIPALTSYVAGSASHAGVYDSGTDILTWTIAPLNVGETVNLTFDAMIDGDAADDAEIRNRANIAAPNPVLGNEVLTTVQSGEFILTKKVDRAIATLNDTLTYTIIYNNASGINTGSSVIFDTLPAGLNVVSESLPAYGSYIPNINEVNFSYLNIAAGEIDSVKFKITLTDEIQNNTSVLNHAVFNGTSGLYMVSNEVETIIRYPELEIDKIAQPSLAAPGDTILYTLTLTNTGMDALLNAELVDTYPSGLSYLDGSARLEDAAATVSAIQPVIVSIGTLNPGQTVHVTYRMIISETAEDLSVFTNRATLRGLDGSGHIVVSNPAFADVSLSAPQLRITKTANSTSGTVGSLVPFTITVENLSDVVLTNVTITDSMPGSFKYIEGSTLLNGVSVPDPTGDNPYYFDIGDLEPGEIVMIRYIIQLTTLAGPGVSENIAWAQGSYGTSAVTSIRAIAEINVYTEFIPGAIRGRITVDCDGDGITEYPHYLDGIDIYLENGSMSRSNEKGMFFLNTVKAGTHSATIDTRDLEKLGYRLAEDQEQSVFVHVNEAGESYIFFRTCPALSLKKEAGLIPKIKVTKNATLNRDLLNDTAGVMVDYEIKIQANEWYNQTDLRVVDSFPQETRLIIHENQPIFADEENNVLVYHVSIEEKQFNQSVYYSLEDLAPGIRRFLTNKIYLEGDVYIDSTHSYPIKSFPTEVEVGPFKRIPTRDIQVNVVGAYFESARARLLPEAIPILSAVSDTMSKYLDAEIKVVGHTDLRPINTPEFPSNWELSKARAKSVVDWIVDSAGIDPARIVFDGQASTHPVDTGWTMNAFDHNRRVEVYVKSFKEGGVDLSQLTSDHWSNYAVLELSPIDIDTLFRMPSIPIETGLADTWEVTLKIGNGENNALENLEIVDTLPESTQYVTGSAHIGREKLSPIVTADGIIRFNIESIPVGETELIYRVMAPEGTAPTGGGAAAVKVDQKEIHSNPVRF